MAESEALSGVKVADFSWFLAGPYVTRCLAAYGATVVRVESNRRPDALRTSGPFKDGKPGIDRSTYYPFVNANKYSISLNMNVAGGKEVAGRLIAWADIVVENFVPGMMERWGLGYEDIRKVNPGIIMLRTSNQGQTGSQARQPGFGQHLVGLSGFSYYSGWPDRVPIGFGMAYTDMITPRFGSAAVIAALDYRRRTGRGQLLDISQLETAIHFLSPLFLDYGVNGRIGDRDGNRCEYAAPHGAFPCRGEDSWIVIAVFTDHEWDRLARLIDRPWTKEAQFGTFLERKRHESRLEELIGEWTSGFSAEELMGRLQCVGIAAGVVQTNEAVFDDPQLVRRGSFWNIEHGVLGVFGHLGSPFLLSETPARPRLPAPCLGEHTGYVCTGLLGMPDERFAELSGAGAFD